MMSFLIIFIFMDLTKVPILRVIIIYYIINYKNICIKQKQNYQKHYLETI